ncbi:hypothetical protein BJX70DRAFT_384179 [Aspergillus crustosus]
MICPTLRTPSPLSFPLSRNPPRRGRMTRIRRWKIPRRTVTLVLLATPSTLGFSRCTPAEPEQPDQKPTLLL